MKPIARLVVPALLALSLSFGARAQDVPPPPAKGPVYVVTFLDVAPGATTAAIAALARYRDASRKEVANLGADVYQENGQSNRFMIQEIWREQPDYDRHAKAASAAALARALQPLELGPPDSRLHRAFSLGPKAPAGAAPGIFVMVHLDVAPPLFATMQGPLKPFVEASRKEDGEFRFDLLQHVEPRQNHLTMLEAWRDETAFDAHQSAAATKAFRAALQPILGALYDQRLYKIVR
jgi:quinol monooxygenase YgiN